VSVGIRFGVLIQLESYIPSDRRFTLVAVADSIYCLTGTGLRYSSSLPSSTHPLVTPFQGFALRWNLPHLRHACILCLLSGPDVLIIFKFSSSSFDIFVGMRVYIYIVRSAFGCLKSSSSTVEVGRRFRQASFPVFSQSLFTCITSTSCDYFAWNSVGYYCIPSSSTNTRYYAFRPVQIKRIKPCFLDLVERKAGDSCEGTYWYKYWLSEVEQALK
jgi:hypothetical protein